MLENIIKALPENEDSKIIVTTRFHSVAAMPREVDPRRVKGLTEEESRKLFEQAFYESKGSKDVTIKWTDANIKGDEHVHSSFSLCVCVWVFGDH